MVRRRQKERGAIAILAALLVMVLGGFLALTLDIGHKFTAKAALEGAGDGAALAGANSLNGMASGLSFARQASGTIARSYLLDKTNVAIDNTRDVTIGFWNKDEATPSFHPAGQTVHVGDADVLLDIGLTPQYFNAIKVVTAADGGTGHNSSLNVFFGAFVGYSGTVNAKSTVTAVGGGPCDEDANVMPVAVPSCSIADTDGSTMCDQTVQLSFNWGTPRDIAFADLTPPSGVLDEREVVDQTNDARNGRSQRMYAFVPVAVGNGSGYSSSTIDTIRGAVCGGAVSGCPTFVFPVINVGTDCSAAAIPGHPVPVGFTNVIIRNVTWSGPTHTMDVFIACERKASDQRAGCAHFGFPSQYEPTLVKTP